MVKLETDVSGQSVDSLTSAGALSTITVQSGKAKIVLAILKLNETFQVRIRFMSPDLTDVGTNLEEARQLRQEHDELTAKLNAKQKEVAAIVTRSPASAAATADGSPDVSIHPLAEAWKDVSKQMEYRKMLLDQSVAFHSSAQQFAKKMQQLEDSCSSDVQVYDVESARRLLQEHQDLKKGVLEASMATLQEGQNLLERIRQAALCSHVQTRHATTSSCYAIERLLQLLQDKWRRLEELWLRRLIQLQQALQLGLVDQEAVKIKTWLDSEGDPYIGKKDLGDSLDTAYSLQEECLTVEAQYSELPNTINRLVGTADYLLHSALPSDGECGAVKQRLTSLQRRVDDFGKMIGVRRRNVTSAAQFFSLAQVATVKLAEVEAQLTRGDLPANSPQLVERHVYLASAIVDISTAALHSARSLLARVGTGVPAAKGVETAVASLEERCNKLLALCSARFDPQKQSEAVIKILDSINKLTSWYIQVGEAIISHSPDMGANMTMAQEFLELYQSLVADLKNKVNEIKAMDVKVEEMARSTVEKDVEASKDLSAKLKPLCGQFEKLLSVAEKRLKLALSHVAFQRRVTQLNATMDLLELQLKLEKIDPSLVPDISVKYKDETFKKMNEDWSDVESKGKQFVTEANEQSTADEKVDVFRSATIVEALLMHFSDRKSILVEFYERWKSYVTAGKEFKTEWEQFVRDTRQTMDWIMKVEEGFFPKLAGELGSSMGEVKQYQKRLEDFRPTIAKAQDDTERLLKSAELLSLKGDTRGQRDQIVNALLKVHTRFTARIGEYRFLLNMAEKFFENLGQLDELIKTTEKQFASEEMPKEVSAAQTALREHNDSRTKLQQLIDFASDEADQIVVRVRQQDSEAVAKDEVQRVLQMAEDKRNAWDKAWQDQKKRLEQNFQVCQFYFDLKQLQDELDELQRQLDMRSGNFGSSLSSVKMIAQAFLEFARAADGVEGRVKEFMGTADRMVRDRHFDSRRIRHEVDETERRWKAFYNSIKNYEGALADSTKFFENWDACEGWITDAAQFLLGISREAPNCQTSEDVDNLIKKIEAYRIEGYKDQDGRLNEMERIVTDLYGQVAGPEKLQPLLDKNQEMYNAFVRAIEELAVLRNNLNKTEQILASVGAVVEQKAPRQPRFVQGLQNAEISDGHGFTFECRLECDTAAPLIEWFKDDKPMSRGTTDYKDGLCRLTLDIVNVNDSATYRCKATTSAGTTETSAVIKVKEPQQKIVVPQVTKGLRNADAPEGTSLTLECYLSGIPYPTVSWFKDGVCIDGKPDYIITPGNNSGEPCSLKIRRLVASEHSGVYSIRATNPGGDVTSEATINVLSVRKPEFTEPLKDETVQEGRGVRLECKYVGEPAPQIQWMCNDVQILPSAMFKITVDVGTTSLEIREVWAEDCGIYSVVARNLGGESRTSGRVGLLDTISAVDSAALRAGARRPVKPLFVEPLEPRSVLEGGRTRLDCVVTGYPEPEITWLHNENPVKKTKDIDILYENGKCSLIIHEVYLEDSGEYVCVGKNEHGSASTSCRLIVESLGDSTDAALAAGGDVPPKFTQLLKDIEGTEGELVRFECRVIGHPTPTIKWFRGRTQVENSPDFQILSERELQALTIPMVCRDDAGNYMIKANNDAGQAKCYATLIVKPASDRHAMKMRLIESCHSVTTNVIEGCSAPEITRSFRDLHVRPGDPCTMEVVIEGKPKPKVHWLFNNELVSKDYQVNSFGDVYSLNIPSVQDKDAGRFSVIAENASGKAWCSALLVVVEVSQLQPEEGSPPETPVGEYIQPVHGPMPLFSAPKPAPARPQFTQPLSNYTVEEGEQVTLECQVTGQPEPVVRWYKEGRPLYAGPQVEMRQEKGRMRLILYGLAEKDSGRYTCIAQNNLGENSTSSTLIVNAANTPPQLIEKLRPQRVREGDRVRLAVRVSGQPAPEVSWFRNGVQISSSPDFTISSYGDVHVLDIGEVFYEDSGTFSARVTNSAGQTQSDAELTVEKAQKPAPVEKPQFTRPLSNQTAQVGQRITLECAIPPYPEPDQVRWYRNEVFLEISPAYQPAYHDGICSLTIPYVTPDHTGKYACVVFLHGVQNSTDMYLEVVGGERQRPEYDTDGAAQQPQFAEPMKSTQVVSDQDAVFVCHLIGQPLPSVNWYHNERLIRPSRRHEMRLTRDGVCTLRIKNVTPDDAGRYKCMATNLAGQSSCHADLDVDRGLEVDETSYVSPETLRRLMMSPGRLREGELGGVSEQLFKPVFRKVPADLEVQEGQLARFDCVVSGRPIPDMLWYRDGDQVHPDPIHKIVINEEGISSLIIDTTRLSDAGLYTCIARNKAGEDRFQVRLNILPRQTTAPPRFLSRLANQTVSVGQSVTFEAEVSGVPVPLLSWQKDGCHIAGSEHYQIRTDGTRSTLFIPSVRPDDDAWYQCTAASVSGIATNRVRLIIQVDARRTPVEPTNIVLQRTTPTFVQREQEIHRTSVTTSQQSSTTYPAAGLRLEASGVSPPRLVEPMRDQHLNDGMMAHFWCKVSSSTPPTCEWFHNNVPLRPSDKLSITNNTATGEYALMVFNVRPSDAGVYKCVVSNPGGEVTCIAHLFIESVSRIPRVEHVAETRPQHAQPVQSQPVQFQPVETAQRVTTVESSYSSSRTSQRVVEQQPVPVVSAAEPPRFTHHLQDVTAIDGSEVTLSCTVVGRPSPTVSWFHNDRNIDQSSDFAITYDEHTGHTALVIVDCMTDDRGQFRCVAVNPAGRVESTCTLTVLPIPAAAAARPIPVDLDMSEEFRTASAQLAVLPSPGQQPGSGGGDVVDASLVGTAPKFVEPIQPCVVIEGDRCVFRAVVTGDPVPEVAWLKEKQDMVLTSRHAVQYEPSTGVCSLTIQGCNQTDTGVYSCRATNMSGRATCTANVVVVPPNVEVTVTEKTTSVKKEKVTTIGDQEVRVVENSPTFTETLLPVTEVNEGDNVRLHCSFAAEPKANVVWRFNGVQLSSNPHIFLSATESQSTFSINGANLADTGEYVCSATNPLGEATTKTFLRVKRLDKEPIAPLPVSQSYSRDLPADTMPLVGHTIAPGSAVEVSMPLVTTVQLDGPPATQPRPPRFTVSLHNQSVTCGKPATFTVQFEGHPVPAVSWFVNGMSALNNRDFVVTVDLERQLSTLSVPSVSTDNEGEYMCRAENSCGTAFTNSHLFVVARSPEGKQSPEGLLMIVPRDESDQPTTQRSVSESVTERSVSNTLFTSKIAAERPVKTIRTDATHSKQTSNVFVPISFTEKLDYSSDLDIQIISKNLQVLQAPVPQPQSAVLFSETVAVDTGVRRRRQPLESSLGDRRSIVERDIRKIKTSTLNVEQKAQPLGYRMEAVIDGPQTFSETLAVDATGADRQLVEIELRKLKTSALNVERHALPRGVRLEAEVIERPVTVQETAQAFLERRKCVETVESHRQELSMRLEGAAPVFVVELKTQHTMDGGKVAMACRVHGNPMPTEVEWFHNGHPVRLDNADLKTVYDAPTGDAKLLIAEVFPEDAGVYDCAARNVYGEASTTAELQVEAYEYIPDSEESFPSRAASSISSAASAEIMKLVAEEAQMTEEVSPVERDFEEAIQIADVKWCVPDLIKTQHTEVAAEFLSCTFETSNASRQEVAAPVRPVVRRSVEETFTRPERLPDVFQGHNDLQALKVTGQEDRASETVTSPLETTAPSAMHPASWAFPLVAKTTHETAEMLEDRVPSPQTTSEESVDGSVLNTSTTRGNLTQVGFVEEHHSESEEEDLFCEAREPPLPVKFVDGSSLVWAKVGGRQFSLTQPLKAHGALESTEHGPDELAAEIPQPREVAISLDVAAKELPKPSLIGHQETYAECLSVDRLAGGSPVPEVGQPFTVQPAAEQAKVEEPKLSLVWDNIEVNKFGGVNPMNIDVEFNDPKTDVITYELETSTRNYHLSRASLTVDHLPLERIRDTEIDELDKSAAVLAGPEVIAVPLETASGRGQPITNVPLAIDLTASEIVDHEGVQNLDAIVDNSTVSELSPQDLATCAKQAKPFMQVDFVEDVLAPERIAEGEIDDLNRSTTLLSEPELVALKLERTAAGGRPLTNVAIAADITASDDVDGGIQSLESVADNPSVSEPIVPNLETCSALPRTSTQVAFVEDVQSPEKVSEDEIVDLGRSSTLLSPPQLVAVDLERSLSEHPPLTNVVFAAEITDAEDVDKEGVKSLDEVVDSGKVSEPLQPNLETCSAQPQPSTQVTVVEDVLAPEKVSDDEIVDVNRSATVLAAPELIAVELERSAAEVRPLTNVVLAADVTASEDVDKEGVKSLDEVVDSTRVSEPVESELDTCWKHPQPSTQVAFVEDVQSPEKVSEDEIFDLDRSSTLLSPPQLVAVDLERSLAEHPPLTNVDFAAEVTSTEDIDKEGVRSLDEVVDSTRVSEPVESELDTCWRHPRPSTQVAVVEDRTSPDRIIDYLVDHLGDLSTTLSAEELDVPDLARPQRELPAFSQVQAAEEQTPAEGVQDGEHIGNGIALTTPITREVESELVESSSSTVRPVVQVLVLKMPLETDETIGILSPTSDVAILPVDTDDLLVEAKTIESEVFFHDVPIEEEMIPPQHVRNERSGLPQFPDDEVIEPRPNEPVEMPECIEDLITPEKVDKVRHGIPDDVSSGRSSPWVEEEIVEEVKTVWITDETVTDFVPVDEELLSPQRRPNERREIPATIDSTDLMVDEEVKDESLTFDDLELLSAQPTDVESPFVTATTNEYDVYFYDEETFTMERISTIQLIEEIVSQETVMEDEQLQDATKDAEWTEPFEILSDLIQRPSSSTSAPETFVLPQVIVHRVEATSRLSPTPRPSTAEPTTETPLVSAVVDEMTVFSQDEEIVSTGFIENKIRWEEAVDQVDAMEQTRAATAAREVPTDEEEVYSSGEEVVESWTVEERKAFEEIHDVDVDMCLKKEGVVTLQKVEQDETELYSSDEEVYSSGEETMTTWTVEQRRVYDEAKKLQMEAKLRQIDVTDATPSAPVFTVPLYNTKAVDGSTATLECCITGYPRPDIKWFVDGTEIRSSIDFQISYVSERCWLIIADVLPEDEGEYKVVATNSAGSSSSSAYLTVVSTPEPEEELYSSGEETVSEWTVENKKVFDEFKKLEIDINIKRSEVVTEASISQDIAAAAEQQVDLYRKHEAPVFTRELESLDVFESTPVRLECEVKGFPLPEITWYQDGNKIVQSDRMKLDYADGRCSLMIDRVSIDDEAEYICEARNEYGTVSTWAELLVEKLIEGLEQLVVEEFYEVEIEMNFKWKSRQPPRSPKTHADAASLC